MTAGQLLIHAGVWGCPCSQCGSRALLTSLATAGHRGLSPGTRMRTERARWLRPQLAHDGADQPVNSSTRLFNLNTSHILIVIGKNSSLRRWLVTQSRREQGTPGKKGRREWGLCVGMCRSVAYQSVSGSERSIPPTINSCGVRFCEDKAS